MLLYKQIIRPVVSYAFPVWFTISSAQMERLRRWERSILNYCLGLRPTIRMDGTFKNPSCRVTYDQAGIDRIDRFLMRGALNFIETANHMENSLVLESLECPLNSNDIRTHRHLPPAVLPKLNDEGLLYNNDNKLLFYHRRYNQMNVSDTVYITSQ